MSKILGNELSPAQLDIYLNQQLHPECPLYNVGGPMVIRASVDIECFRQAHAQFVRHHDALSLCFDERGGIPSQYLGSAPAELPCIDFSGHDQPEAAAREWTDQALRTPFDLRGGPAHRSALLRLGQLHYWYVACAHHIVLDGWSYALWAREVVARYEAIRGGTDYADTPVPALLDVLAEEREYSGSKRYAAVAAHWDSEFVRAPTSPVPLRQTSAAARPSIRHAVSWRRDDYARIETFATMLGASAHHVLLALTYAYFAIVSGENELVIGVPSHNRHRQSLKSVVGSFATISPIRVTIDHAASFMDLVRTVKERLSASARHPRHPLNRIRESMRARGVDVQRLFDVQFNYQRFDHDGSIDGIAVESHHFGNGFEQVPAVVTVCDYGRDHDVEVIVEVNTAYFDARDAQAIAERLSTLLDHVSRQPGASLAEAVLLPEAERERILRDFNDTDAPYPAECLHQAFERNAALQPDAIAVSCDGLDLSYAELDTRANRLAHWLLGNGVRPDDHVAVCLERSLDTVVALLGILKSGAAYVPLDPAYPEAHLSFTLEDSRAVAVLAHRALLPRLERSNVPVLCLDDDSARDLFARSGDSAPRVPDLTPAHTAYIIYTSGSTGRPKGVCIEHRQAVAFVAWARSVFPRDVLASVIAGTSLCFDLSVFELFVPLSAGTRVTVVRHPVDKEGIARAIAPTLLNTVPSAIGELLRSGAVPATVRTINLAGEPLSRALVDRLYRQTGVDAIYNLYGPSEDTTYSTFARMRPGDTSAPSIGQPIANGKAYVLDRSMRPVPIGVAGELYLGGAGVARGYLNRPELTDERFLPDPFDARSGARMYRTGDWARWRHDGELDFLGRLDHQIKIRGFRIELGEIEAQLGALAEIAAVAVVVRESALGEPQLIAYVVPRSAPDDAFAAGCQQALRVRLPEHMVPAVFVVLDALPLTPNGKIDRKALPSPRNDVRRIEVAPRNEREAALCAIWRDLLQHDRVGIHDSFFELGGESLRAMRLVGRIRSHMGFEFTLRDVFECPTVAAQAARLDRCERRVPAGIAPVARGERLPASFAQQRLWFIDRFENGSAQYHMAAALRLDGDLDFKAFAGAVAHLVHRHEALRTRFVEIDGQVCQRIDDEWLSTVARTDLCDLAPEAAEAEASRLVTGHASAPFDLERETPLRVRVLHLGDRRHVLLFNLHHIAGDGWSINILLRELDALYMAEREGRAAGLPELPVQYADYAVWQRQWLDDGKLEAGLRHWRDSLSDLPAVHRLPLDRPRSAQRRFDAGRIERRLDADALQRLREACGRHDVTLFMYLHSALSVLLARFSGETDIVIGTPTAGRVQPELEGLIGLFVNTLVLRSDLSAAQSFAALLGENKRRVLDGYANQHVPFDLLVEHLNPVRSLAHNPLVQVLLTVRDRDTAAQWTFAGAVLTPLPAATATLKFDLELDIAESGDGLALRWDYATGLWDAASIERLAESFDVLLAALLDTPDQAIGRLPILSQGDRSALISIDTGTTYPPDTLPALFEAHARERPDDIALVFGDDTYTYGALDAWANRLAHALHARGAGAESRVGLYLHRSPDMVAGLLAVLKAGAAYVPLDPAYPPERLRYMLDDAAVDVVLSQSSLRAALQDAALDVLCLDSEEVRRELLSHPAHSLAAAGIAPSPADLAYIIYTSGSTGRPKGVCVEHRSLANLAHNIASLVRAEHGDTRIRWAWNASLSFDASLQAVSQIGFGAAVHLLPDALRLAPIELMGLLRSQSIDVLDCTPSQLRLLLDEADAAPLPTLFVGGEAIGPALWDRLVAMNERNGQAAFNVYGPSETCVDATACRIDKNHRCEALGHWLANVHGYVLDPQGEPVPAGVVGELYIGGAGVARGYWRQPVLTGQRFLPDSFSGAAQARMYRTGDLVRRTWEGQLVFIGRNDDQTKLNGFRIELGEIEARLMQYPHVLEAAVVVVEQDSGQRRLVACVVAAERDMQATEPETDQAMGFGESCRRHLAGVLPAYMVPASYLVLDAMPVTPSGKVDRKALSLRARNVAPPSMYAPARGAIEQALCALWQEVLGVERVGRHDDFFELGGHSIAAIRLVSRLRRDLGWEMPLRVLFERPTIAALAASAGEFARPAARPVLKALPRGEDAIPLSYAQQRLWFLEQLDGASAAFNIAGGLSLRGVLDRRALAASLDAIVSRHEVLRTAFIDRGGIPVQNVLDGIELELEPVELAMDAVGAALREFAGQPFELSQPPLFRTRLFRIAPKHHVLALSLHHIIGDGWSLRVLTRELAEFYRAYSDGAHSSGEAAPLPALEVQYADYAHWQRECLQGAEADRQLDYWRTQLQDAPELLNLPMRKARGQSRRKIGGEATIEVPAALARALAEFAERKRTTLFVVLLAAFKALLARLSGQDDIVVGTPSVNRREAALEDMVGLFLDHLALRTRVEPGMDFETLVDRVHGVAMDGQAHAELPFERIVDAVVPNRDLSRHPLFQVFFNMVNLPALQLAISSLEVEEIFIDGQDAKFDLTLYAHSVGGSLALKSHYDADLFSGEQMRELLDQYVLLLGLCVGQPMRALDEASLLTALAREVLPDPEQALDSAWLGPVHVHFDRQVERDPDHVAVRDLRTQWSYRDLQLRSRRLAAHLRAHGVGKGDVIAIYAARRAEIACALLATFRLGAVFVMLDPSYPAQRTLHYLDIARPKAWLHLTDGVEVGELASALGAIAQRLDLDAIETICSNPSAAAIGIDDAGLMASDLAYLAFTSGSTGLPKAVEGRHGSLTHFLPWLRQCFGFGPQDRFSLLSGLAHDPLHRDVFTPLMVGATLCIPEPEFFAPVRLHQWMQRERISVSHLTPSISRILCDTETGARLPELRCAFLTGELLTTHDMHQVARLAPNTLIVNFYGSTETQRAVSYHVVSAKELPQQADPTQNMAHIPLGRGIPDVQLLLLNAKGLQAGIGEAAEIFIRSPHLARGYWQDESLTASRFMRNAFTLDSHDILYRTGDLGRYRPDGQVEALGRIDHQVKIRGFRIEPGEIEAQLSRHAQVKSCVVIARDFGAVGTALVAYVVPVQTQEGQPAQWKAWLGEQLPAYMVPAVFVVLDALPLTPNGKIDRKALPAPGEDALQRSAYVPPRTELEQTLCALWAELLGLERVGIHDNFFDLGGHSLLATRLVSQVRQRLACEVPLRVLFEQPTVAELAMRVAASEASDGPALATVDRSGGLPLSYAQQRLWFIDRLEGGSPEYNMPSAFRLEGTLDEAAMQWALDTLLARHEVLRTRFVEEGGEARQIVDAAGAVPVTRVDLRHLDAPLREDEVRRLTLADARRAFDLGADPMIRVHLLVLAERSHVVLFNQHHIVSDGWSLGVLVREFGALYAGHARGEPKSPPPLPIQYGDYAVWQRQWLQSERLERELEYWRARLADLPPLHGLPLDRPRPALRSFNGSRHSQRLDADLLRGLHVLCRQYDVTLFMLLQTAFAVLLSRYSGQYDIVMGTPIAGRTRVELEGLIGFFVNTLVLRTDLSGNPGFSDLLVRSKRDILDAYTHQNLPFERLVDELKPARELSHNALVQIWFHLQNYELEQLELPELTLSPVQAEVGASRFELELHADESADGLALNWIYNLDLFATASIERMSANFRILLESIVRAPEQPVQRLPLITAQEHHTLREWNRTAAAIHSDGDRCVHALFEAQARLRPQATALIYEDRALSYAELNVRANRLAHYLIAQGVGPDTLVGLCMERSSEMVVGLLAILKAGGAYVPLDPAYPPARLQYMLVDSGVTLVLTQSHLEARWMEARLPDTMQRLSLDLEATQVRLVGQDDRNPVVPGLAPRHLAYMIYTSGSTGQPKGVLVEHEALLNRLDWMQREYGLDETDRVLQKTPYSFDVSVWEFLWPLMQGAQLVLARPEGHKDPGYLRDVIQQYGVTTLHFVPSMLNAMLAAVDWSCCTSVRRVFCSGEALSRDLVAAYFQTGTQARLHNLYGPTEAAIDVSHWDCGDWQSRAQVPIGRPIQNIQLHVLNDAGELQPIGAPGELHIGGVGLARGYRNQPGLTAEKFVESTFMPAATRLYRTGDLARWLPDGTLEYLGRNDFQVKIRGFRIELGEIEAKLSMCAGVREAVVIARHDEAYGQQLVAYVVAHEGIELSISGLRQALSRELAEYMVPSAFVRLEELPLTANGKLDRKALPGPDETAVLRRAYEAPMGEVEQALARIWQELLGVERVGRHDHFFELGGHSLLLMQSMTRIRERLLVDVPLRELFARPVLSALAEAVSAQQLETFLGEDMKVMQDELDSLSETELLELLKRESVND